MCWGLASIPAMRNCKPGWPGCAIFVTGVPRRSAGAWHAQELAGPIPERVRLPVAGLSVARILAELETALGWIRAAGGLALIAHPARYHMTASKLRRLIGEFRDCGGVGMEVVSGSHTRDNIQAMAALCRNEGLLASSGSDYHGPENCWIRLGELPALPVGCTPVWESERWPGRTVQ